MDREQIKKALECCGSKGSPNCHDCPMEEGRGCAIRLYREALAYINKQETEYNELYELCESYRKELMEKGVKMELNREQIKKALECCANNKCTQCHYHKQEDECVDLLASNALSLIKELTEEIKDLTETVEVRGKVVERLQILTNEIEEDNRKLTEDNEYLKTALTSCEARYESRKESDLEEVLELRLKVDELTEENERLRADKKELINENAELKNQLQEEISEEDLDLFDEFTKLLNEGIRDAKANNVSEIKTRFAIHFGTYTDKDMTPIIEVFRLLDKFAEEVDNE